jgi:hypothetical protein
MSHRIACPEEVVKSNVIIGTTALLPSWSMLKTEKNLPVQTLEIGTLAPQKFPQIMEHLNSALVKRLPSPFSLSGCKGNTALADSNLSCSTCDIHERTAFPGRGPFELALA